ncbi:hypothetical protein DPMN_008807 [Dreissena polymorpha]|uniref:Uncharacterized protein n=1 Tax=Dreissena polymorpha TaxID=45954 RepID=A0A9D4S019_DREPO|nr:hypothetical protein DPMN_008807 [Dreissena polymorpha]
MSVRNASITLLSADDDILHRTIRTIEDTDILQDYLKKWNAPRKRLTDEIELLLLDHPLH